MDIGKAFSYVFDDEEWIKKILIGGAFSLIPLLGSFIVYGYMLETARRAFRTDDFALPDWDDIGGYLTRGFIFWLGLALWALPFFLLFACSLLFIVLLGVATGEEAAIGVSLGLFYIVFFPLIMLLSLGTALVIPVLLGRYANDARFGAMFEISEIIADVRRIGFVPLLLLGVTYMVAGYVGQLGIFLCLIGVIFTGFYGNLVIAHAAGQYHRLARGLEPLPGAIGRPPATPLGYQGGADVQS